MQISPLNLISTPIPVMNSLGLRVKVGLSSEDPLVWRQPSQTYQAYLTIYAPDGSLVERRPLGSIPPLQRRFFDLTDIARSFLSQDHLVVVHRVPQRLLGRRHWFGAMRSHLRHDAHTLRSVIPEDPVALPDQLDYSFFRAYIQYSFHGSSSGNGSVIYEVPYRFNESQGSRHPSSTLTFTTKAWLSNTVNTYIVLMNYSTDPTYRQTVAYRYGLFNGLGHRVTSGEATVRPFTISALDLQSIIPPAAQEAARDPADGAAVFSFIGYCENAAMAILVLNLDQLNKGFSVEHTHPSQAYLLPFEFEEQNRFKTRAVQVWKSMLTAGVERTHDG